MDESGYFEKAIRDSLIWHMMVFTLIIIIVSILLKTLAIFAFVPVTLFGMLAYLKRVTKLKTMKAIRYGLEKKQAAYVGMHRISLQESCIENENYGSKSYWKYKTVESISETTTHVFVNAAHAAFIIPKRATTPELLTAFLDELRTKMDAAKKASE